MTVVFIALMAVMLGVIWCINHWYLGEYYTRDKIRTLNSAYEAINAQLMENRENGITFEEAMSSERDSDGNIVEGNIQSLVRELSDTANISFLMIDYGAAEPTIYSTNRDTRFLKDRMDRYIFGRDVYRSEILEEYDNYKIEEAFDPGRDGTYLESWGFFSDDRTAFIMSTPLSSISEGVELSNRFLLYVGLCVMAVGAVVIYLIARGLTRSIDNLAGLSEKMSDIDSDVQYEPGRGDSEEVEMLGNSMNVLSGRLKESVEELKTANEQLQKDNAELAKADEKRQEFVADVSHELKTPIALIQGYAEGLQEGLAEDKESRDYYCDVIVDEAQKMNTMVRQLLELSSLESGSDETEMTCFDMTELIVGVLHSMEIMIQQNEIRIEMEETGPILVVGDEFDIEQVVSNYLSNAINHAGGDKRIVIRQIPEGDVIRVSVFNTGEQIPEESIPELWDRFYKVDKARTRDYGGTGIGLSIVKAVMDAHGQRYGVQNWNDGVEFWFTIKAASGEDITEEYRNF